MYAYTSKTWIIVSIFMKLSQEDGYIAFANFGWVLSLKHQKLSLISGSDTILAVRPKNSFLFKT